MFARVYYGIVLLELTNTIALITEGRRMEGLVYFWRLAAKLKTERRKGWVQRLHLSNVESVADHSYGVAMLSLYMGKSRGCDVEKLLKLALIHDLEESVIGDLTPLDKRKRGTKSVLGLKRLAMDEVLRRLPLEGKREYRELWTDLNRGLSREARLVKDLDALEMALQAGEYGKRAGTRNSLPEFYRSALKDVEDPALKEIVRGLARARR